MGWWEGSQVYGDPHAEGLVFFFLNNSRRYFSYTSTNLGLREVFQEWGWETEKKTSNNKDKWPPSQITHQTTEESHCKKQNKTKQKNKKKHLKVIQKGYFFLFFLQFLKLEKPFPPFPWNEPLPTASPFRHPDSPESSHFIYFLGGESKSLQLAQSYIPGAQFPGSSLMRTCIDVWESLQIPTIIPYTLLVKLQNHRQGQHTESWCPQIMPL